MSNLPDNMADIEPYKQAMRVIKPVDAMEAFIRHFNVGLASRISRKITSLATRKSYSTYRNATDNIEVKDIEIEGVPVRIYKPTDLIENGKSAGIIFIHGGFWVIYNVEDYDQLMYNLANKTRSFVASIEYKLSPEYRFPTALDEVFKVSKYVLQNTEEFDVDRSRIAICGDSTGGNMAAATVHRLVKQGLNMKWQCLIQAPLQFFDLTLPSYQQNVPQNQMNILTYEGLDRFLHEYLNIHLPPENSSNNSHTSEKLKMDIANKGYLSWSLLPEKYRTAYAPINKTSSAPPINDNSALFHEDVSPLLASDETLKLCPNTHLVTSEYDIFRDDSYIYAARLKNLGVNSVVKYYENGYHGALNFYQNDSFKFAKVLFNDFIDFLLKNL